MEIEGNTLLLEDVEAAVCIVKEDKVSKFLALIVITKKIHQHPKGEQFLDRTGPQLYGS